MRSFLDPQSNGKNFKNPKKNDLVPNFFDCFLNRDSDTMPAL